MADRLKKHRIWFAIVALLGAGTDFLSKELAFHHLEMHEEVVFVDGFFHYFRTLNPGIVWGQFSGASTLWLVISVLAVPAITAIFLSMKRPHWIMTASLGLILGGTIGNMYDRVAFGAVRDFIKFYYAPDRPWPVFNLADSCICVGVALLSLEMLFFDDKKKKQEAPPPAPKTDDPNVQNTASQAPPAA